MQLCQQCHQISRFFNISKFSPSIFFQSMFKILLKTKSTFKKLPKTITFAKISPKLLLPNLVTLSPLHFIFLLYLLITCTRPLNPKNNNTVFFLSWVMTVYVCLGLSCCLPQREREREREICVSECVQMYKYIRYTYREATYVYERGKQSIYGR